MMSMNLFMGLRMLKCAYFVFISFLRNSENHATHL